MVTIAMTWPLQTSRWSAHAILSSWFSGFHYSDLLICFFVTTSVPILSWVTRPLASTCRKCFSQFLFPFGEKDILQYWRGRFGVVHLILGSSGRATADRAGGFVASIYFCAFFFSCLHRFQITWLQTKRASDLEGRRSLGKFAGRSFRCVDVLSIALKFCLEIGNERAKPARRRCAVRWKSVY